MLLSAVSVLVVAQWSLEVPEGLMNNPVFSNNNQHKRILNIILWNIKLWFSCKIISDKDSGKLLTDVLPFFKNNIKS
jgi:hypothetical protein